MTDWPPDRSALFVSTHLVDLSAQLRDRFDGSGKELSLGEALVILREITSLCGAMTIKVLYGSTAELHEEE